MSIFSVKNNFNFWSVPQTKCMNSEGLENSTWTFINHTLMVLLNLFLNLKASIKPQMVFHWGKKCYTSLEQHWVELIFLSFKTPCISMRAGQYKLFPSVLLCLFSLEGSWRGKMERKRRIKREGERKQELCVRCCWSGQLLCTLLLCTHSFWYWDDYCNQDSLLPARAVRHTSLKHQTGHSMCWRETRCLDKRLHN